MPKKTRIMVFRPKYEDFKNFEQFINHMEAAGAHEFGVAKVIPPKEWKIQKNDDENINIKIHYPLYQFTFGEGRTYFLSSEKFKCTMRVAKLKKLTQESNFPAPKTKNPAKLERLYWKHIGGRPSIYGADLSGTLFSRNVKVNPNIPASDEAVAFVNALSTNDLHILYEKVKEDKLQMPNSGGIFRHIQNLKNPRYALLTEITETYNDKTIKAVFNIISARLSHATKDLPLQSKFHHLETVLALILYGFQTNCSPISLVPTLRFKQDFMEDLTRLTKLEDESYQIGNFRIKVQDVDPFKNDTLLDDTVTSLQEKNNCKQAVAIYLSYRTLF